MVDLRAGHGPGIGGFKPESEIGVAVRAGHPCYFATFLPHPTDTQTVEDVMRAEARFLEEIIALHPQAEGRPVVVGNRQAGWQIMMTWPRCGPSCSAPSSWLARRCRTGPAGAT